MAEKYDLVVVGAGPAGSLAAKTVAEKGFKVVFLERGRKPGEKSVGGELLTRDVFHFFPWMAEGPIEQPIQGWTFHLYSEGGRRLVELGFSRAEPYGYTVHRPSWDLWVSRQAELSGAKLKTSTLVERLLMDDRGFVVGVETSRGEKIYGSMVIGADGVASVVAREAGLRGRWPPESLALCLKHFYTLRPRTVLTRFRRGEGLNAFIFIDGRLGRGYGWVFPYKRGIAVGLGLIPGGAESLTGKFEVFLSLPAVRNLVDGGSLKQHSAHLIPLGGPKGKTFGNGVLLAGDAAGFPCPLEGAGYEAAAYSGLLAGEVACEALSRGEFSAETLAVYEERWRQSWIARNIDFGRRLQRLILDELGVERLSLGFHRFLEALSKHGSHPGISHPEAVHRFFEENREALGLLAGKIFGFLKV